MVYRVLAAACIGWFCLGIAPLARAGDPPPKTVVAPSSTDDPAFRRGALDFQFAEGAEVSIQHTDIIRPNFDYQLTVFRLGYMVDTPHGSNFLRGNNEFLLEAIGGPVTHGPGTALGGLSIMYRRNFLSPGAKAVPYFQVGGGGIYSDASHDKVQQALGSDFEFNLQAGVGTKFRLSPRWSADAEFSYRHFSNAHITDRNLGINGIGGLIGVSRAF